jgi:hypothetical protein
MAITLNGTTGITTPTYNGTPSAEYIVPVTAFKNRIINGAMVIDQRNAGASVTPTSGQYLVDRWRAGLSAASKYSVQQNAGSVTPPAGFSNYLGVTSLSAYSVSAGDIFFVGQRLEGFNTSDLNFGTASAQTITVSFWVRSSLTGTFCVAIGNSAFTRSYVATYTVSSANTWEYKTISITGDTTGTWVGATNGVGLYMNFTLGAGSTYNTTANTWAAGEFYSVTGATSVVGTNGATFYITGVQLEKGSNATSFDYRPYGTELALCQRYLPAWNWVSGNDNVGFGYSVSTVTSLINVAVPVTPRVAPTGVTASAMTNFVLRNGSNTGGTPTSIAINVGSSQANQSLSVTTTAGSPTIVAGQGAFLFANGAAQILFTGCEL